MFCLHTHLSPTRLPSACRDQKRLSDLLILELTNDYEPPCGCWDSNPDPLQEQQVLCNSVAISPGPGGTDDSYHGDFLREI